MGVANPTAERARGTVTIAKGKARLFWDGNPLVYGGAVASVKCKPQNGDIVDVSDESGKMIGWGVYNADSMYRVRLLAREGDLAEAGRDLRTLLVHRLRDAQAARAVMGLPSSDTTTYRLVNGEGDGLSGLVADVFGGIIGVSASALWVQTHKDTIIAALKEVMGPDVEVVWRLSTGRLQQDGWVPHASTGDETAGPDMAEALEDVDSEGSDSSGRDSAESTTPPPIQILESGVSYWVQPAFGQKTGFYCDQRDNRALIRSLSQGKTVLDLFCYSGGFGLNAALGGATQITAVDSSEGALDAGVQNAKLNGLEGRVEFVKSDAGKYMEGAAARGELFDMVILDPPKLAPNKKALPRATGRYKKLNAGALSLVRPGGLLFTFTCSAAMTQSGDFMSMVQAAAVQAGRRVTLLKTVGPAADHTLSPAYMEGAYLTGALLICR